MSWSRWYAIKSYVWSTIWIAPVAAVAVEQTTFRIAYWARLDFGGIPGFVVNRDGTIAVTDYVISASIAFIVFTFSSLLVAIQVASGQLTARIIATTLLRNRLIRSSVGIFVYALLLAIGVKARVDTVPQFLISLTGILGLVEVLVFMFLIDYASRLLRPISILVRIAEQGLRVIEEVYPQRVKDAPDNRRPVVDLGLPQRTIPHRGASAIVIAINLNGLVAAAKRADCIVEFAPRIGDFVTSGDPLFVVRGGGATRIDESALRGYVAFGSERTIEQDSIFAFRVIVDIALKALSPAINDPTTAVLAIDQLQRLLRSVGQRHLHDDKIHDDGGRLRLILRTPNWDDFVHLTLTELRHYGAGNVQVARRIRAMIERVMKSVPETRVPALLQQLALLDIAIERVHLSPEDLALARVPDSQGLGGASIL